MLDAAELSSLVGDIYDASLDPTLWRPVLIKICGFLRGGFSILITEDAASSKAHVHYTSKDDPEWLEAYFRKYIYLNPTLVPAVMNLKVGDIFSVSSFMTHKEFRASSFYREWAATRGYMDTIGTLLAKTATGMSVLSAVRHESDGPVNNETRRRMKLIGPHVRRAVSIGRVLDMSQVTTSSFADTLDGFAAAIVLVDAKMRVVYANPAAVEIFESGEPLLRHGSMLAATSDGAGAALISAVQACADGDAAVGTKGLAIPMTTRGGNTFVAHMLPLTASLRRPTGAAYGAVAAIFIRKMALEYPSPLETLADHYHLTARELSVLLAVVELGGVPAVASLLGLSEKTVKTYLRSIFQKTGSNRQADLVKIIAGFANPFAAVRA
jgi:DNA-binding CsgD family transcriptional regulator/PAS domain-containing protein